MKSLGQPLAMQCEIWLLDGDDPCKAMLSGRNELIGLLAIPLQLQVFENMVAVAKSSFDVRNVIEGLTSATLQVCITVSAKGACLLKDVLPEGRTATLSQDQHCDAVINSSWDANVGDTARSLAKNEGPCVPHTLSINHEFQVHILSITKLPPLVNHSTPDTPVARYLKCVPVSISVYPL